MAKRIKFTFEDNDYTLEFTRRTVREMEREGFIAEKANETPMTSLPKMFAGSFKAHHKYVKPDVIEKIFAQIGEKEDLFSQLVEMYNETLETLFEEPEDNEKKIQWKTDF